MRQSIKTKRWWTYSFWEVVVVTMRIEAMGKKAQRNAKDWEKKDGVL